MSDGRSERAKVLREERRAQILDTALQVFATRGYHHTSISDLVDAAGVARGTFYQYFDGKQQIFVELLDQLLGSFRTTVRGIDVSQGAPLLADQLEATVMGILDAVAGRRAIATILFREAVGLDEEVELRVRGFEDALHGYVRHSLDNGVRLGWLRPHDTEIVAACVYGSIRQIISRYVVEDRAFDARQVASEIVHLHLTGLVAS